MLEANELKNHIYGDCIRVFKTIHMCEVYMCEYTYLRLYTHTYILILTLK